MCKFHVPNEGQDGLVVMTHHRNLTSPTSCTKYVLVTFVKEVEVGNIKIVTYGCRH